MNYLIEHGFEHYERWLILLGYKYYTFTYSFPRDACKDSILSMPEDTVIFCGARAGKYIKRQLKPNFIPGCLIPENLTEYDLFLNNCPKELCLNDTYKILTTEEAFSSSKSLFEDVGPFFLRPTSGYKPFDAIKIRKKDEAIELGYMLDTPHNQPNAKVAVCPLKIVGDEYRFYIVNNQILASASYLPEEGLEAPHDMITFVNDIVMPWAKNYCLNDFVSYTVDVTETKHGFRIVEFNSISGSGVYRDDITPLIINAVKVLGTDL